MVFTSGRPSSATHVQFEFFLTLPICHFYHTSIILAQFLHVTLLVAKFHELYGKFMTSLKFFHTTCLPPSSTLVRPLISNPLDKTLATSGQQTFYPPEQFIMRLSCIKLRHTFKHASNLTISYPNLTRLGKLQKMVLLHHDAHVKPFTVVSGKMV